MHISEHTVICVITAVHGETCPKGSPALYQQKPRYEGGSSTEVEAMCVATVWAREAGCCRQVAALCSASLAGPPYLSQCIAISILPSNVTTIMQCLISQFSIPITLLSVYSHLMSLLSQFAFGCTMSVWWFTVCLHA